MAINRKQILEDVVAACGISFDFSNKNDLDFCKEIILLDSNYINFLPLEMLDNKEIALLALSQADDFDISNIFEPLSSRLKDDDEVVNLALSKNFSIVAFVSDRLLDNEEFMVKCCHENTNNMPYASERLLDKEEFVFPLIEKDPLSFCFASERIRNNLNLFLKFFPKYPEILKSAGYDIVSNIELMRKCFKVPKVKSYFKDLYEVYPDLGDDKEIVLKCLHRSVDFFSYVSNRLKDDKDVCKKAVDKDVKAYRQISENMKKDKEFAIYCLEKDSHCFYSLNEDFRFDKKILLLTLKNSFEMCYFKDYIPNDLFDELKNLTVDNAVIKLESIIAEEELNKVLIITSKQNKIKL